MNGCADTVSPAARLTMLCACRERQQSHCDGPGLDQWCAAGGGVKNLTIDLLLYSLHVVMRCWPKLAGAACQCT